MTSQATAREPVGSSTTYTVNRFAEILQVSRSTILRLVAQGWPHARIGRSIRFTDDHLAAWLDGSGNPDAAATLTPTGRSIAAHRRRTRSV